MAVAVMIFSPVTARGCYHKIVSPTLAIPKPVTIRNTRYYQIVTEIRAGTNDPTERSGSLSLP